LRDIPLKYIDFRWCHNAVPMHTKHHWKSYIFQWDVVGRVAWNELFFQFTHWTTFHWNI